MNERGAWTVTAEQAATMLGIGRSLTYECVRTGKFPVPAIRVGSRYLLSRATLERLLDLGRESDGTNEFAA